MSAWIEAFRVVIEGLIHSLGYPGIYLLMLVENVFPPLPSEAVLPFAGFMVATGQLSLPGVVIAGVTGSLTGTFLLYWAGRSLPEAAMRRWVRRRGRLLLLAERDLDQLMVFFQRYGQVTVLFGRLLPGIRSLISIPAGLERMPFGAFALFTLLGTVLWNTLLVLAGISLENNWQQVLEWVDHYERILWVIMAAALAYAIVRRLRDLRARQPG